MSYLEWNNYYQLKNVMSVKGKITRYRFGQNFGMDGCTYFNLKPISICDLL